MSEESGINDYPAAIALLRRLSDWIEGLNTDVERLAANSAASAVRRNRGIAELAHGDADKERQAADMMLAWAETDYKVLNEASGIAAHLDLLDGHVGNVAAAFERLRGLSATHFAELTDKLASANADLGALRARSREHACHNSEVREQVWAMTGGKCYYCETDMVREMTPGAEHRQFQIDHIVPKTSGGPDHIANYVPACRTCNTSKNGRSFVEFTASRKVPPKLTLVGEG